MQSYVNVRRTNNTKKYQSRAKTNFFDDYKENSPPDNLLISDNFSLSLKDSSSSNVILQLSGTESYSIDDATTQSYKLTSSSTKSKSVSSESREVIVISDSSDHEDDFLKKPEPSRSASNNLKKLPTSSIYISSSSDESDEGDDFILKYSGSKNTLSDNNAKRRISNNFKPFNNFKTQQRCSILYTSDDTASTASNNSKSSSSKKSKVSAVSSISHVSPTPRVNSDNLNKDDGIRKLFSKPLDKLKNRRFSNVGVSPSFCSTKYQKLFPRKNPNRVTKLSKAEALKILRVVKSKRLNYFSASDKSQVSDSQDSGDEKRQNGRNNSNIIDETTSENSKTPNSEDNQNSRDIEVQKSNIIEETDSEEEVQNRLKTLQIQKQNAIKILQTPPPLPITAKDPGYNNLSASKRKEIATWLMSNNPESNNDSSVSHISVSNRNSMSSGNSSLERLEMNFETPNNRYKFFKSRNEKVRDLEDSETQTPTNAISILNDMKLVNTDKRVNVRTPLIESPRNSNTNSKASTTGEKRQSKIDEYLRKTKTISGKSVTTIVPRKPPLINLKSRKPEDVKIEDCVNILDKLYGDTWRAKADAILSEPRKQHVLKKDRGVQTDRKLIRSKDVLNLDSESEDENVKHFVHNVRPAVKATNKARTETQNWPKKVKPRNLKKKEVDNFINDNSSSDGSAPSSYYTAITNPTLDTLKKKGTDTPESTSTLRAKAICDPESDESYDKKKTLRNNKFNRRKLLYSDDENDSSTSEFDPDDIVKPKIKTKKPTVSSGQYFTNSASNTVRNVVKKKNLSFLESLDASVPISNVHPDARVFRENFKKTKEILCQRLFVLYNENIFDNKLPKDMLIDWSTRMRGTAGFCYNKKSIKSLGTITRSSRIVLSTKVLDRPDRLRDTLVHEMCHAASWIINEISDGHGPIWKGWAKKAMKVFPELPAVSVCHNYKIHTKFTYKCTSCGYSIGRHSKSLNTELKRCGYCHGKFELFINRTTKSGNLEMKTPTRSKDPSAFALYVKENYQNVKQNRKSMKHGEVMKVLGQQFSAIKIAKKQDDLEIF